MGLEKQKRRMQRRTGSNTRPVKFGTFQNTTWPWSTHEQRGGEQEGGGYTPLAGVEVAAGAVGGNGHGLLAAGDDEKGECGMRRVHGQCTRLPFLPFRACANPYPLSARP